uniref:T9SS type A sorting domain-containing protein n=1 Tax=Pseudopedobacter sp. TaxID=1936787 RepID=UPI00333F1817
STDGKNFSNIGTVDNTNSSYYSFTDSKTDVQGAYYKLQKIDTNNSTEYSKVIRVNSKINNGISLSVYPNPTSNALNIVFSPREETSILKIVSILGQVIYQTTVNSLEKQVVVQTEKFTPGNYIIILERGNNKEFSKFIKQ